MSPKAARVIVSKFKQIMSLSRKKKKKIPQWLSITTKSWIKTPYYKTLRDVLCGYLSNLYSLPGSPQSQCHFYSSDSASSYASNKSAAFPFLGQAGGGHLYFLFLVAAILSPPRYPPSSPGSLFILWPLEKKTKQKCFLFLC